MAKSSDVHDPLTAYQKQARKIPAKVAIEERKQILVGVKLTCDQRKALIGKSFVSDMNNPVEFSVTVHDVECCGGGYTVKFTRHGKGELVYCGLQRFLKRFPYEIC